MRKPDIISGRINNRFVSDFMRQSGGAVPENTVVPAITGTAEVGEQLTTSNGTWSGTPTSYTYQWKRNGVNISLATNANYTLTGDDAGKTITVTVTAVNAFGNASATSTGTEIPSFVTPTQQAHSLVVSDKTETTQTMEFQNPGAVPDNYLVLYRAGSAVDFEPVDGTPYTIGQELGTGNFVGAILSSGDDLDFTLLDLDPGTTYYTSIFAYNGSGSGIKYRTANERGHRWATDSAPATGMIGTAINAAKTLEVRTGGVKINYRTRATVNDSWGAWAQWGSDISGGEFHSCVICEGGTIHNASGTPVSMKLMVNDHSGSAKVYAGYAPGDTLETVFTGSGSQKWNDGAWNASRSEYMVISDTGTSRVATLANARTVSTTLAMDAHSIASVCATDSATVPFLICFKNTGTPGQTVAALVNGTWTMRNTIASKQHHMIRFTPGLGGSATRVCCSSADGTGNDFMWSDDYFATVNIVDITGEFGAFAFDDENIVLALFSRTAGADLKVTVDGSNFDTATNPVANIVMFNGVSDGNGFNVCASSGTSLGIKSTPSNITSAKTWPSLYLDWMTVVQGAGVALPSSGVQAKGRAFIGTIDAVEGLLAKIKALYIIMQDGSGNTFKYDLITPASAGRLLLETGTNTFTSGSGWAGNGTNGFLDTQFIPSTEWASATDCGIFWDIGTDQEATVFEIGVTGDGGSTSRILVNTHATDDTVGTVAFISGNAASNANATSVHFWGLFRNALGAIMYRDNAVFDSSLGALGSRPNKSITLGCHNNNGTKSSFATRQFKLYGETVYLTEAEYLVIYNAWQTYKS
jgi:hypothetical protein